MKQKTLRCGYTEAARRSEDILCLKKIAGGADCPGGGVR